MYFFYRVLLLICFIALFFFFFKQKTAYEMRISDWSSDVCSSDLKPVAILNLGGVANITFIGEDGELIAFDTGMASALIDNWVQEEGNATFDAGGALAGQGRIDEAILTSMLDQPDRKSTRLNSSH